MAKVELLNIKGEKIDDISLNKELFGMTPNDNVLYDAIILARASLRQGTHKTKNRSEVSGGGRKPWKQKGTGRARQGSIRSVQWRGGGNYGTPVPRDYSKKQNRKERRLALKSALAHKANEKAITVLENLTFKTPKTKEMVNLLTSLKMTENKVLFIVDEFDDNVILSSRNLENILLISADEINVLDLVAAEKVIMTKAALAKIEEGLN